MIVGNVHHDPRHSRPWGYTIVAGEQVIRRAFHDKAQAERDRAQVVGNRA
jgi:hypothetical protein